jgi:transposase
MATSTPQIIGGVDTHRDLHVAAAIDPIGRVLGHRSFPATPAGYRALLAWLRGLGQLQRVGVEGTGAYGAGLLRHLRQARVTVVEVDRPDRRTRRRKGKSDPVDAEAAARAALAGTATGIPKGRDGRVEAIRALRVARRGAMKARTAAGNQLGCLVVSAPEPLRGTLRALSGKELVVAAARLRPGPDLTDAVAATKAALRRVAHRYLLLSQEIAKLDQALTVVVAKTAPRAGGAAGGRHRCRWTAAGHRGGQPEPAGARSGVRPPVRRGTAAGELRTHDRSPPLEPWWRPRRRQQRLVHNRDLPAALGSTHPRLHATADQARDEQAGSCAVLEALRRSRGSPDPHRTAAA